MSTKLSLKSAATASKITSPLAKYNSVGQLFCVLCNSQVKNEMYWTGHINGKSHRDQVLLLKSKGASSSSGPGPSATKRPASSTTTSSHSEGNGVSSSSSSNGTSSEAKRLRVDTSNDSSSATSQNTSMGPPRSILKMSSKPLPVSQTQLQLPQRSVQKTFKQIENEEAMEVDSSSSSGRFNNNSEAVAMSARDDDEDTADDGKDQHTPSSSSGAASASLPAGFFDDAKEDAKARGVDYRNPEEAEWEKFVKEIATEDVKSSALRTADEEDSAKDRELDEIEEQMKNWQRVVELERKAQQMREKQLEREILEKNMKKLDEDDDEDIEYEEELDWRSKKY